MHNSERNREKNHAGRQSARHKRQLAAAVIGVTGFASFSSAASITETWDGTTSGNWDLTGTNKIWNTPAVAWADANTALFNGAGGTVTVDGNVAPVSLQITATGYTIGGTSTITVGTGASGGNTTYLALSAAAATISAPLTINADKDFLNVASGDTLTLSGTISTTELENSGTAENTVYYEGGGTLTITSAGTIGGFDMKQDNGGAIDLTGNLTFGGSVSGGFTDIGDGVTSTFTIDTNATLNITNAATNNFKIGNASTGSGTLIQNAGSTFNFTPTSSTTFYIGIGSGTGVYTMNGGTLNMGGNTMWVGGAGASGSGTLNVYSGASIISAGTLVVGESGPGTVNQSGGNVTMSGANDLVVSAGSGDTGVYNLGNNVSGGTLTVAGVKTGGGTSTFNFNGGTLLADAANTAFMTGLTTVSVNSGGGVIDNGGNAIFINQALLHGTGGTDGGLVFQGAGMTTIRGANTYNGGTTVNAGTLVATSTSALGTGSVALSSGAALNYAAPTDAPLAIGGTLAITGGAGTAIGGSIGSTATTSEINVAGAATATAAPLTVNIYGANGVGAASGTNIYTLVQGGSGSNLSAATLGLGSTVYNDTNFTVGALGSTANSITVSISSVTPLANAYWTGGYSGAPNVWSISDGSTASNWAATSGGAIQALVPGSAAAVTISNSALTTPPTATVLGDNMTINSLTIADTTNGLGLNFDGNTLTITPSSPANGITMNASVPASTIGANVALGAAQTWTNNSANVMTISGTVTNGGNLLTVAGTGDTNISGAIAGAGGLTKNGAGTLILTGASAFTGTTTLTAGVLNLGSAESVGIAGPLGDSAAANAGSIVLAGGYLQYSAVNHNDYSGRFSTAASQRYNVDTNGQTVTWGTALISSGGSLTKIGSGTLNLTKTETYSGPTTVSAGILRVTGSTIASSAVGVSAGAIGGTGTINGAVTLSGTGGIDLRDGGINNLTLKSTLSITGVAGANNLYFDLGSATATTDKILVTGNTTMTNSGAAVVNVNQLGGIGTPVTAGTYTLIQGTGTIPAVGNFSLATTKADGQTFSLSESGNSLQLNVAAGTAGPIAAWWAGGTDVNWTTAGNWNTTATSGASSGVPGYQTNVDFYTSSPTVTRFSTTLNADQDVNSLNFAANATTGVTIAGSNTLTIEATNANSNTASHGITITAPSAGTVTDTVSANVGIAASQTWTVNTSATLAVSGNITDFGLGNALTKAGAGVLTLSGANSYSGGTTISTGTVLANSADTVNGSTGTGLVTVASGATLGGTGQIRGSVTVNGTITAGSSATTGAPGTLTITGSGRTTTFAGGGTYSAKISAATGTPGTDWDEIIMSALSVSANGSGTSAFTVAPVATLTGLAQSTTYSWDIGDITVASAATFNNGNTGVIPTNTNLFGSSISAPFALSTSGFSASLTGSGSAGILPSQFTLELVSDGTGGDFLQLGYTSAPEPGTAMLILGGAMPMLTARRRRIKRISAV